MGAMGFIPKTANKEVLLNALRLISSGGIFVPADVHDYAHREGVTPPTSPTEPAISIHADIGLTERQSQVLALLLRGMTNKLICRELGLAEGTVKIHISAILKLLGVANRTQAVLAASRIGLRI